MAEHIKINNVTPRVQYVATTSQTVFTIPFPFFEDDDIVVYEGSSDTAISSSLYTLSGAGDTDGGTLTYTSGKTAGTLITITRESSIARTVDFGEGADWSANNVNDQFDKQITFIQEVKDLYTRAIKLPVFSTLFNLVFPDGVANKLIGWNSDGTELANIDITSVETNLDAVFSGLSANDFVVHDGSNWVNKSLTQVKDVLGIKQNNYSATAAPTVNDDSDSGYSVGSKWIDITNDNVWHCVDATVGAAVWELGDLESSDLGAAAVKGVDTDFSAPSDDNVPTTLAIHSIIQNYTKGTKATQSTGTSLPAGAWTTLTFDSEEYDDGGWHDTSTNNSRITVDLDGRYILDAVCEINTTANGDIGMRILVNGSVEKETFIDSDAVATNLKYDISGILNLSANDYVEIAVWNDSGALTSQIANTYFTLQRTRINY